MTQIQNMTQIITKEMVLKHRHEIFERCEQMYNVMHNEFLLEKDAVLHDDNQAVF